MHTLHTLDTSTGPRPARVAPSRTQRQPVPRRRVRHDVRDGVVVAAFTAAACTGLALVLLLLTTLAGQAT